MVVPFLFFIVCILTSFSFIFTPSLLSNRYLSPNLSAETLPPTLPSSSSQMACVHKNDKKYTTYFNSDVFFDHTVYIFVMCGWELIQIHEMHKIGENGCHFGAGC